MKEKDALEILRYAVEKSLPYENTADILRKLPLPDGSITVFAIGKAAVPMAKAAGDVWGERIKTGLLVTKYDHAGDFALPYFTVIEASHPVSDENSVKAAEKALEIADSLTENDTVLVLLSGGGSALFEKSKIPLEAWQDINRKLLKRGAPIEDMNRLRNRFSTVKGGKFAGRCYPAEVITVALSDVLSNDKGIIAGGITVEDKTDDETVRKLAGMYLYDLPPDMAARLYDNKPTPVHDGGYYFAGDIRSLCDAAVKKAAQLGYTPRLETMSLRGEAREKCKEILDNLPRDSGKNAYIYGGETTVTVKGQGKGGRNQEMALTAAIALKDRRDIVFASLGSDGTDGPTDAAGGIVTGNTYRKMTAAGVIPEKELDDNNAYDALKKADALIITGATGTNVNDITLVLSDR